MSRTDENADHTLVYNICLLVGSEVKKFVTILLPTELEVSPPPPPPTSKIQVPPLGVWWSGDDILDPGGGTRLSCGRGGGGAAGGRKPDPVAMRSVHKKYTLSQYTLLKICICIPCRNIAPSLVPRSRACHKHCGLGTHGKQPCDKRSSPPVAN